MQRADVALYDNLISPAVLALLPPIGRADLRRQAARRSRDAAGGDQRAARAPRARRQARAAPEGRRSVHLRPRRRGDRHAVGATAFRSKSCPASPRRSASPRMPASRSRIATTRSPACSSPATSRTAAWTSTGPRSRGRGRRSSSTWACRDCRCCARSCRGTACRRRRRRRSCSRARRPRSASSPARSRTLPRGPSARALHGPTLIIVGDVVRLRARLNWFKPRRARTSARDRATPIASAAAPRRA